MIARLLLAASLLCLAHAATAQTQQIDSAASPHANPVDPKTLPPLPRNPKVVLELFTSQGCASCPPADALLSERAGDKDVLALTMAVDYWDYIGWKDTLALHGHAIRQKAYAEGRADRKVFTPQVIVNGQFSVKGSDRNAVETAMRKASRYAELSVPVKLEKEGSELVVALPDAEAARAGADVWACPVARQREVAIGRGENSGRSVNYTNVVRGWIKVGRWDGAGRSFRVPLKDLDRDGADSVAVFVQTGNPTAPGHILGASTFPLN